MFARYFKFFLFCVTLLSFTQARGDIAINANGSLDVFEYDLDTIHLKLEKFDARWQLFPLAGGRLQVDKMRAKRLTITTRESNKKSSSNGLPEHIKPPFPIKITQAEISEVVILTASGSHHFNNVKFDLEADANKIKLSGFKAATPWGEADVNLQMATSKPFALEGQVSLAKSDQSTPYDISSKLSGDLANLHFESDLLLVKHDGQIAIMKHNEDKLSPVAKLSLTGQIGLQDHFPISSKIFVSELHPENLGHYPAAQLNLELQGQGELLPSPNFKVQYKSRDSKWKNQDFDSSGEFLITDNQIRNLALQAKLAGNTLKAQGNLGQSDSKLEWQADFSDISAFGDGFSGNLSSHGTVTGSADNTAFNVDLNAEKLNLPNSLKIEKLNGQVSVMSLEQGKVIGEFKALGLHYQQQTPMNAQLNLTGTRANHQIKLTATDVNSSGNELKLETLLHGELIGLTHWHGLVQNFNLDGISKVKLTAPAKLMIDDGLVRLADTDLQLTKGHATINLIQTGSGKFASKGQADHIALEDLPKGLLNLPASLQGNPTFSAKWDFSADETLNGNINFWHDAGDLILNNVDGSTRPLGLQDTKIEALFEKNHVILNANITGQNIGNLDIHMTTEFSKTATGFTLVDTTPLTLKGSAHLKTLAWIPMPTSLMDASVDGVIDATVEANGTIGKPNLIGSVTGDKLLLALPTDGVNFINGVLEASFEHNQLLIKKASWQGGDGTLSASGAFIVKDNKPTIDLDWKANNFTAISRADRLLTIEGSGKTILENDIFSILGNFTVIKGLIELADEDTPVLGNDVVILGQSDYTPDSNLKVLLNGLRIDLGKSFTLRGKGLDAILTGAVTLTGLTEYRPHTEGIIQVQEGSYYAYGQKLTIERGIINFNGTVDNPGINIRAMRNSTPTNAGVEITGTAYVPITKLVSVPEVAESEKLSWLVLGHGMDQTTKNDYGLLSLAAGVLLSQGQSVPLQTQLARAAGLDEFSFAGGDADNAAVVFGKRLTSRLYLSYQKSISGLLDVARLTYTVTSRWSIRGEAGTESAVDVLYTFRFK